MFKEIETKIEVQFFHVENVVAMVIFLMCMQKGDHMVLLIYVWWLYMFCETIYVVLYLYGLDRFGGSISIFINRSPVCLSAFLYVWCLCLDRKHVSFFFAVIEKKKRTSLTPSSSNPSFLY
ncbi:hypothetical protein BD770DRAFT_390026 [Pilaira anomala]|nr:hypothetical protein BD770DRAFT_390026 [Pilaira anomala]